MERHSLQPMHKRVSNTNSVRLPSSKTPRAPVEQMLAQSWLLLQAADTVTR